MRTALLVLVVLIPSAGATAELAAVTESRPRMLLTAEELPRLRKRCRTDPVSAALLAAMKARADGMMNMTPELDNQGRHYLPTYALLYLITGEKAYGRKAAEWLMLLDAETIENPWTCLEYVPVASFTFDWIHDLLTPEERLRAGRGLLRQLARVQKLWRHSDYNNHFLLEHMSGLHVALTLAHEPGFESRAAELLRQTGTWLKDDVIPAANEQAGGADGPEAGGHSEGFSYNNWGYARPLGRLLAAWKSATGEDLFSGCIQFRNDAIWNAYGRLPDGTMVRSEDCPSTLTLGQDTRSSFELQAREYGEGIARTLADGIEARYPQVIWPILIFRDPTVRPAPLAALPRARRFRGIGHVYSNSAFDNPDAVVVTFQCGPQFAGHQHADNNAFTVYFRGRLAIDSGVNEYSAHRANYYSRTVAHNTITVLDPDEEFPSAVWSGEGTGGANDGGQRRAPYPLRATATREEKAAREIGEITHYDLNDERLYVVGDATKSYRPGKVRRFVRHLMHVYPDLVLVLDDVETGSPDFETRWLLHTRKKPVVDGDSIAAVAGDGALFAQCLWPPADEREIRVVGGPGREFLAGGTNHPPDETTDPNAGAWRVEVVDSERRTRHVFLHAILAVPAATREAEAARWTFGASRRGEGLRIRARRTAGGGRPAVDLDLSWRPGELIRE